MDPRVKPEDDEYEIACRDNATLASSISVSSFGILGLDPRIHA